MRVLIVNSEPVRPDVTQTDIGAYILVPKGMPIAGLFGTIRERVPGGLR